MRMTGLLVMSIWLAQISGGLAQTSPEPLQIYDDQLRNGFTDWSWASRNLQQTAVVHQGERAVSLEPGNWQGLFFHRDAGFSASRYESLAFWIHGGTGGGQIIQVAVLNGGTPAGSAPLSQFLTGGQLPTGQWVEVTVSLAALGLASGNFDGIWFQDGSGINQPTLYLDDLRLLPRQGDPPPGTAVTIQVNPLLDRHPIDPLIYGVSFGEPGALDRMGYTLSRWGGNSMTRYSWEDDASNRGSDWFFFSYPEVNPHSENLPDDSAADRWAEETLAAGAQALLTVPLIGWTPRDRTRRWGFSVEKYGAQQKTECTETDWAIWCNSDAGNGIKADGSPVTGNDPHDTSREIGPDFVSRWVEHLTGRLGTAAAGGIRFYALDNEPMLWNTTHRDVHPAPVTYDELWTRTLSYAPAVKSRDPGALVLGPVVWGWCAYFFSAADGCSNGSDLAAHGRMAFLPWYLQQVQQDGAARGFRLVDYLDIHYYPQADGVHTGGESYAAVRLRSLKSLYDPDYTDESWIGQPVRLIPRMREWIDQYAPGMKLALTEYNWGPDNVPSAALAQAEALAIFGREGVDLAARWVAPEPGSLAEDSFSLYLNYDGQGGRVAGDSVRALSASPDDVGGYAISGKDGRLFLLLFNHDTEARPATVAVPGSLTGPVRLYRFDAENRLGPAGMATGGGGQTIFPLPPRSATLAVAVWTAQEGAVAGDANGDRVLSVADRRLLADWLAGNGPAGEAPFPVPLLQLDLNADGRISLLDLIRLDELIRQQPK